MLISTHDNTVLKTKTGAALVGLKVRMFKRQKCLEVARSPPQMIIQIDALMTGWMGGRLFLRRRQHEGTWCACKQEWQINILKLLVVELALLTSTKKKYHVGAT